MRTEAQEQQALVQWLRIKKIFHFAPSNENQGSFLNKKVAMIQERKAQSMGKMTGIPDIFVFLPDKILAIELKRARKRLKSGKLSISHVRTSPSQIKCLESLSAFDYCESRICYGFIESRDFIIENME